VPSSALYIAKADLRTASRAQEEPTTQPRRNRTQKSSGEPSARRGQRNTGLEVRAADSEVGGQVEALTTEGGGGADGGGGAEEKSERGDHHWVEFVKI